MNFLPGNLIGRMLEIDPRKRPTIEEVLKDVYFGMSPDIWEFHDDNGAYLKEKLFRRKNFLEEHTIKLARSIAAKATVKAAEPPKCLLLPLYLLKRLFTWKPLMSRKNP